MYSQWSEWNLCSPFCGKSIRTRSRSVLKGICNGSLNEEEACINTNCSCLIDSKTYLNTIGTELPVDLVVGFIFNNLTDYSEEVLIDDSISIMTKIRTDPCTEFECSSNGLVKTDFNCTGKIKF